MELFISIIGALIFGIIAISKSELSETRKATIISLMVLLLIPACLFLYAAGVAY